MDAEVTSFGEDIDAALAAYAEKERSFLHDPSMEIVLVGSDSMDSVRATHSNYFPNGQSTKGWLVDLGLSFDKIFGRSGHIGAQMAIEQ